MPDRMPTLPPGVVEYQRTRTFDEASVPAGLLANHQGLVAMEVVVSAKDGERLGRLSRA